jgi:hypothetical protein
VAILFTSLPSQNGLGGKGGYAAATDSIMQPPFVDRPGHQLLLSFAGCTQ